MASTRLQSSASRGYAASKAQSLQCMKTMMASADAGLAMAKLSPKASLEEELMMAMSSS